MTSCESFLDVEPVNSLTFNNAYENQADLEAGLNGAYNRIFKSIDAGSAFGTGVGNDENPPRMTALGDIRAGREYWGTDGGLYSGGPGGSDLYEGNATPNTGYASWQPFYVTNNIINTLLELSETIPFSSTEQLHTYQGELYFLRAFNYFFLLKNWGDVPIIEEPYKSGEDNFNISKSERGEVAALIASDIAAAEPLLGNTPFTRVRATSGSLNALKAHFYAWKARVLGGGNTDLNTAVQAADDIIGDNNYSLMSNYSAIFYNGYQSSESIFELEATADVVESNLFVWARDPYRVGRLRAMLEFPPEIIAYFNTTPQDSRIEVIKNEPLPGDLVQQPYISKWLGGADPDPSTAGPSNENDNFIIFRLGDIILLRAECLNTLGQTGPAKDDLDLIRGRAGLLPSGAGNQTELADSIFWERRIELLAEGHLWYDIVRNGKALDLSYITDPNEIYLPVHQGEIDINSNLVQNPFYD